MKSQTLVVGLGEVGKPLLDVLGRTHDVVGKDLTPVAVENVDILHVCYPFQIEDFVLTTIGYIREYQPAVVVINSTVVPGTTARVEQAVDVPVLYSPVRGKHSAMRDELLRYTKFVAGTDSAAVMRGMSHFAAAGMKTSAMSSPEALELAKLLETVYFGVLIAWAQEMERFCRKVGADYGEVQRLTEEIDFLPRVVFEPGYIGGHCIIPNSYLLDIVRPSGFCDCMRHSNELKKAEWEEAGRPLGERLKPRLFGSGSEARSDDQRSGRTQDECPQPTAQRHE